VNKLGHSTVAVVAVTLIATFIMYFIFYVLAKPLALIIDIGYTAPNVPSDAIDLLETAAGFSPILFVLAVLAGLFIATYLLEAREIYGY